jgi:hypothetical protein
MPIVLRQAACLKRFRAAQYACLKPQAEGLRYCTLRRLIRRASELFICCAVILNPQPRGQASCPDRESRAGSIPMRDLAGRIRITSRSTAIECQREVNVERVASEALEGARGNRGVLSPISYFSFLSPLLCTSDDESCCRAAGTG